MRRWFLRILSVLFSFLLWKEIDSQNSFVEKINLPIVWNKIPEDLILMQYPKTLSVFLKSNTTYPSSYLVKAHVDPIWEEITAEDTRIPFDIVWEEEMPLYASLSSIPSYIEVKLDRKISKTIPLVPDMKLSPSLGDYHINYVTITPSKVTVTGPASLLETRDLLSLGSIFVETGGKQTKFISLNNIFEDDPLISVNAETAKLEFLVTKEQEFSSDNKVNSSKVIDTPINVEHLQDGLMVESISPNSLLLEISGEKKYIQQVEKHTLPLLYVDLSNISEPGSYPDIPLRFHSSDNVQINRIPEVLYVEVKIEPKIEDSSSQENLDMEEENRSEDIPESTPEEDYSSLLLENMQETLEQEETR